MAGGEGTRLRPLTCNIPKPMVPVVNKPIMEHIIELIKKYEIKDVAVTLQYMPDVIKDYFGDGKDFGVDIKYYVEEQPLGTAGSIKNAEDFLNDTFVVISGDALTDVEIDKAVSFHKDKKAIATLVLARVDVPLEYGVVVTNSEGRIKRFLEKPSWGEVFSDTVNTGIYILEPEVLKMFKKDEVFDFSKDLFPIILSQNLPIYGYITDKYWCDIGDVKAYHKAHRDIFERKVNINLLGNKVGNNSWMGEGTEIDVNSNIGNYVFIGKDVIIKNGVTIDSYSIIGDGVTIDTNTSIKRSIIWKNSHIGSKNEIRGAIVCDKVKLKEGCSLYEHSIIGSETLVHKNSIIKPNVKVWPNKIVESSTEVNSNVVWEDKCSKYLFGSRGITGEINLDITPEFASKLGTSYGAILGKNSKVGISYNGKNSSQMLNYAIVSGLMASGIKVFNFGELLLPMARKAIECYKLNGGIHISASSSNEGRITIDFLDTFGGNIDKNMERKIENIFLREDFARCKSSNIKNVTYINDFSSFYSRIVLNKVKSNVSRFKIVLNNNSEFTEKTIGGMLKEMGCTVEFINFDNIDCCSLLDEKQNEIMYFASYVNLLKADIGVVIDENTEKLLLIDDKGRIVTEDLYYALSTLILFRRYNGSTVVTPLSTSNVVDVLAKQYNGKIVRSKTSVQEIMNNLKENKTKESMVDQYAFHFDAIESLVRIIDFLKENNLKLSELVELVPSFHMKKKVVECPWEVKGKVMRNLAEDRDSEKVELNEGVKVYKNGGWVLVLPDAEQPVCRIISEAMTEEFAEELADIYVKKINEIKNK